METSRAQRDRALLEGNRPTLSDNRRLSALHEAREAARATLQPDDDYGYALRRVYQRDEDEPSDDGGDGGGSGGAPCTDVELMHIVDRASAHARAKRAEHVARTRARPLQTQPLDAVLWSEELPTAAHIEYRALPPRPEGVADRPLFGWVPNEWTRAAEVAQIVCDKCGSGEESKGNLILLCDGPDCQTALHMACLNPPMQRQPWKTRDWFCPSCRVRTKKPPPPPMRPAAVANQPSPYEQQRLNNIARNQQVLEELGLA